ncbi:ABC transporter permease [Pedobacter sp. ASV28]|uniref:ABC transporter permease n=1 Tax=Pedobacter sp. ASV28 TaxID=2795123 RepID=UPI0018ED7B71|nr:ABC transporter permease [Pedobacter sp. ASV28]
MFKLNLKIALRNLFKNKVYTAINIGGLAIGLTAFVLLLLFVNHEANYDKWNPELDKVYQIRERHDFFTPDNKQNWQEVNESRIGALLQQKIPQFKYITKVDNSWGDGFALKVDHSDPIIVSNVNDADSLFFKVFPYHFIYGDRMTALSRPNAIVIKQSIAHRLFGTDKVLGKQIRVMMWRSDKGSLMTVTGVVAEPETAQSHEFNAIIHSGDREKDPEHVDNSNYCKIYALAHEVLDTLAMNKILQQVYVDFKKASFVKRKINYNDFYKNGKTPGLKAVQLKMVHSSPSYGSNWLTQIKPIIALCIFLLLISIINFVNLATAQSVQRAKEVGVKKVLGAYKKQLVLQFMFEAAIQSIIALFMATILVEMFLPTFNHHFGLELSFWYNKQLSAMVWQLLGLLLLITLLSGFYPAMVLSRYNPVSVLKGNYETGFRGIALRNGLVVLQFVIAVTFIIGIGIMYQQTNYLRHKDLGYDKSRLMNIRSNYEESFVQRIKRIPGVKYVATTTQVMGNTFNVPEEIIYDHQEFNVNTVTVTMETLPALGVRVLKGRMFSPAYKQDTVNTVILNQAAANLLGKNVVGKMYDVRDSKKKHTFQIVGIIKDYHNEGFDKAVLPTVYKVTRLGGTSSTNNLLVRFEHDKNETAVKAIEAEWKKSYPDFPIKYAFAEESFEKEMQSTNRLMQMVLLFSAISVVLSLLGLFALSAFMAKRRTKEIAIRKILGASDLQIVNMLNRSFLILVLIANLISWPIAYIFTNNWLAGFAYRINVPIWPFVIATIISVGIALLTVSLQTRKAAVNNPVDALKYE